jgi:hypothetical protein
MLIKAHEILVINYLTPISNYKFDNIKNNYYLVGITSIFEEGIIITKIKLNDIDNISDSIRAYHIDKGIAIQNPLISLKLFQHDKNSNIISLLFTLDLNISGLKCNSIQSISLYAPTKVLNELRSADYKNEASFLQEQFYNYETIDKDNRCLIFLNRVKKSKCEVMDQFLIKYKMSKDVYFYDRYSKNIIKEQEMFKINNFCQNNTFNDYMKYIKQYSIDLNRYIPTKNTSFKSLFMRKINKSFRPFKNDPLKNNQVLSPSDGRVSVFKINELMHKIKNFSLEVTGLNEGCGFVNRLSYDDYQRVNLPYSGYLRQIAIYDKYLLLKFESNYFIPPGVHEREYISVVYGSNIQMSRIYPDLVDVQKNTKLIFYVIVIGDSIGLLNDKLISLKETVQAGMINKIKSIWFDQGEELCVFNCCLGHIIFMTNRPMQFSSDINHSSIETYVRLNDVVGSLF